MTYSLIKLTLEECVEQLIDYRGKTPKKTDSGIPLITAKVIKNGKILPPTEFIAENDYESWMRRGIPKEGDVVLTVEAPLGEVAQLDSRKIALAQRVITLRGKKDLLNNTFLKYLLMSNEFQSALNGRSSGTTVLGIKQSELRKIQLTFPSLSIQKKIAHILSTLDNKIELNKKINQTLESIAQAIFKSWFVDFDPIHAKANAQSEDEYNAIAKELGISREILDLFPNEFEESELGMIPDGWRVTKLGSQVEIKRDSSPRPIQNFIVDTGYHWLKIADATAEPSPFILKTKEYIKESGLKNTVYLKSGSLILSNSATPGLPKFLEIDACIHDGWLYFSKINFFTEIYLYFLFLELRNDFISKGNGSIFTNLKTDILKNQQVILPSSIIVKLFTEIVSTFFNKIKINCR